MLNDRSIFCNMVLEKSYLDVLVGSNNISLGPTTWILKANYE